VINSLIRTGSSTALQVRQQFNLAGMLMRRTFLLSGLYALALTMLALPYSFSF
jgi:hypothetical protein